MISADAVCQRWFPACSACAAKPHLARLLGSCVRAQARLLWCMAQAPSTRSAGTSMHSSVHHVEQRGACHPRLLQVTLPYLFWLTAVWV